MEGRHLMTNHTPKRALPLTPHPDHLRKEAKARLASLKGRMPSVKLTDIQLILAREYGFANWGMLQADVARRSGQGRRLRHAIAAMLAFRRFRTEDERDDDIGGDGPAAFFQAGLVAQIGFIVVALTGVAIVVFVGQNFHHAALLLQHFH
jgi:hypothetical protein